ncbi:MAG: response regulator transcription factor [Nitrospirae bacterium]|nr:response regulator transcription factor [Nitrospirota bacterium]
MNIFVLITNRLLCEGLCELLRKEEGFQTFCYHDGNKIFFLKPDIILIDINNLNQKLFSQYPNSKIILIDIGIHQDDIISALLSYKIYGVISIHTDLKLFKKALKVVHEGQIWISNSTLKEFLHNKGLISKSGKIKSLTFREREIIEYVSQGYNNKKIAMKLSLSEQTIKAHLNRIYKKFNVSNRSQLIAFSMNNHKINNQSHTCII